MVIQNISTKISPLILNQGEAMTKINILAGLPRGGSVFVVLRNGRKLFPNRHRNLYVHKDYITEIEKEWQTQRGQGAFRRLSVKKLGKPALMLLVMLSFLAFSQKESLSADWIYVGTATNGMKVYVDISSVQVNKNNKEIKVWVKDIQPDGKHTIALNLIYYKEKTFEPLQITKYNTNGEVTKITTYEQSSYPKSHIIPGSVFESVLDFVMELEGLK